jgi:hypothetical protein
MDDRARLPLRECEYIIVVYAFVTTPYVKHLSLLARLLQGENNYEVQIFFQTKQKTRKRKVPTVEKQSSENKSEEKSSVPCFVVSFSILYIKCIGSCKNYDIHTCIPGF